MPNCIFHCPASGAPGPLAAASGSNGGAIGLAGGAPRAAGEDGGTLIGRAACAALRTPSVRLGARSVSARCQCLESGKRTQILFQALRRPPPTTLTKPLGETALPS